MSKKKKSGDNFGFKSTTKSGDNVGFKKSDHNLKKLIEDLPATLPNVQVCSTQVNTSEEENAQIQLR